MKNVIFQKIWIFSITLIFVITSFTTSISKTNDTNIEIENGTSIFDAALSQYESENIESFPANPNIVIPQPQGSNFNNENKYILLKAAEFDPLVAQADIPDEFKSKNFIELFTPDLKSQYDANNLIEDYFLIQFQGPIQNEWKESIGDLGVKFYDYIPDYAFIVYAKLNLIPSIQGHEFVRWVGPYHPYYRVQDELMEMIEAGSYVPGINNEIIMISLSPIADMDALFHEVFDIGADIKLIDADKYLVCNLTVAMARELVFTKNLLWMEFHTFPELLNDVASRMLKIRQSNNGTLANDDQSLWSYNHVTDTFEGFPGNDVVIAMVDSGVDGTHPTFDNKKIWFYNYANNQENTWTDAGFAAGHGTHTSGSSLGTGAWRSGDTGDGAKYAGMAPAAGLIGQAIFQGGTVPGPTLLCNDGIAHGANISSNSWGWPGSAGNYDNTARDYDGLVRNSNGKEFTIVFGTGNEGPGTIRSPSTGKNVISVGATDNNNGNSVTGFSSGGPTDDGRLKPDIVTPGQLVASAGWQNMGSGKPSDGQNSYFYATGTSMATPIAAGAAAVVMDYINHTYGYVPSPALIKAVMINGATPIEGYKYPGNRQGWGRVNLANSLYEEPGKRFFILNQNISLQTNNDQMYFFNTKSTSKPLRITLTWTDKPGTPASSKNLINDLDLILESPDGKIYYGNSFKNDKSEDGGEPDDLNNVEGLYIPVAPAGGWILSIVASNVPDGPQDFALVMAGDFYDLTKGIRDIEMLSGLKFENKLHYEGDTILLNGSFKNNGTIPTINVRYRLVQVLPNLAERNLVDKTVPLMVVQERHYIDYYWSAVRGEHTFKIIVDPLNTLREESETNNRVENPIIIHHFGLEVNSEDTKNLITPGDETTYAVQIRNIGSLQDTFSVSNSTPPKDWVASTSVNEITIISNSTNTIYLTVIPPALALANDTTEISVNIVSQGNNSYTGIIKTVTVVEQYFEFKLETDLSGKAIKPGVTGIYNVTINNTGNGKDDFVIRTEGGKYGWEWTLSTESISISARSTENITLRVTPPADGLANDDCEINVVVWDMPVITKKMTFNSIIDKVYIFDLKITIPTPNVDTGGRIRYPLEVNNLGNIEDSYKLSYLGPENWTANFTTRDIKLDPGDFKRLFFEVKLPMKEFPDEYQMNLLLESLDTKIVHTYPITLEVNPYFNIQAVSTTIVDEVYQGQIARYNLQVTNYGTTLDSVKIELTNLPEHWRLDLDNNVLGLDYQGTNSTDIKITTDVLTEDGEYITLLRVVSAGNESAFVPIKLLTKVDYSLKGAGEDEGTANETAEAQSIFGRGSVFDMFIILIILIIIIAIAGVAFIQSKKRKKIIAKEEEERSRKEREEMALKETYSSLYGQEQKTQIKPPRKFEYFQTVPQTGISPPSVEPKPSQKLFAPQSSYPKQTSYDEQLPLGPLPDEGPAVVQSPVSYGRSPAGYLPPAKEKKKRIKKRAVGTVSFDEGLEDRDSGKVIDVFLPDKTEFGDEEPKFESIKPTSSDVEFEQEGPVYLKSTPDEWKSTDADEYEKQFEVGSEPRTIESKRKKKD
jgi:uncharacterized membrane protein